MKGLILLVSGLCVALLGCGSEPRAAELPDTIKAKSFQLVDREGKVRAVLEMRANKDKSKKDGPALLLLDEKRRGVIELNLAADGTASLKFFRDRGAGDGKVAFWAGLHRGSDPSVRLFDSNGKMRLHTGLHSLVAFENPYLYFNDVKSAARLSFFLRGSKGKVSAHGLEGLVRRYRD